MRLKWKHIHITLAVCWAGSVMVFACNIALIGNDIGRLGSQWGDEERKERQLNYELGDLRHQIEWKASAGYIDQKVRDMGIPIYPGSERELLARQP
jgi:hypothetical protein